MDYTSPQELLLKYANRHGLIAGATGTGKTVTLQILAESFSAQGVPVFLSDVKGDLSGLARAGSADFKLHGAFTSRAEKIGFADYTYEAFPVTFWDLFGEQGHPVRTTVAEMGPLLLARLMDLTDAQEGVLNIAFRVADEEGMPLLDLKDLQALLVWTGENASDLSLRYGNVAGSSIGAIQRALLVLENQGGSAFFGEPALELADIMATASDGRGRINILAADKLMGSPRLYATSLLWLLSELFEELPEVGDPDKPRLVFFFDEAHLLFDDAPKALVNKVEQVARLIRSKGVGVYFVTQSPDDIPEDILGQLGNRVQHALRAFTARDQKALAAGGRDLSRQSPLLDRRGDPRSGCRRGRDLDARVEGRTGCRRENPDPATLFAAWPDHSRRTAGGDQCLAYRREIRGADRPRKRLRDPDGAREGGRARGGRGRKARSGGRGARARIRGGETLFRQGDRDDILAVEPVFGRAGRCRGEGRHKGVEGDDGAADRARNSGWAVPGTVDGTAVHGMQPGLICRAPGGRDERSPANRR